MQFLRWKLNFIDFPMTEWIALFETNDLHEMRSLRAFITVCHTTRNQMRQSAGWNAIYLCTFSSDGDNRNKETVTLQSAKRIFPCTHVFALTNGNAKFMSHLNVRTAHSLVAGLWHRISNGNSKEGERHTSMLKVKNNVRFVAIHKSQRALKLFFIVFRRSAEARSHTSRHLINCIYWLNRCKRYFDAIASIIADNSQYDSLRLEHERVFSGRVGIAANAISLCRNCSDVLCRRLMLSAHLFWQTFVFTWHEIAIECDEIEFRRNKKCQYILLA